MIIVKNFVIHATMELLAHNAKTSIIKTQAIIVKVVKAPATNVVIKVFVLIV